MQKTTYGFDQSGGLPLMAIHTFETSADGQLVHYIDNVLRAVVPPEGWQEYSRQWPDAAEVIASMMKRPEPTQVPAFLMIDNQGQGNENGTQPA